MIWNDEEKNKNVFMVGIGGINMSALAKILKSWGHNVSGSDMKHSKLTEKLQNSGINVYVPHDPDQLKDIDYVIYTAAIKKDNPVMLRAKELNIPIIDRATLLGGITKKYKDTIAISGTHGKTTTTSMISTVLLEANLDPTILVGGELDIIDGNYKIGNSEFLVTEACEYVESFLKFYPKVALFLNIEEDHLDYFRDIQHITNAFEKFAYNIPQDGLLIGNADDQNVVDIFNKVNRNHTSFGINNTANWQAKNIEFNELGNAKFDVFNEDSFMGSIQLNITGIHNIYNALACIATAHYYGVDFNTIVASLQKFKNPKRRFEYKGIFNGITIVDDYAHHPSEIKTTLKATSKIPHSSTFCIFQPHTFTRTKALLNEFSSAFGDIDKAIIVDIYSAREKDTGEIHSKDLVDAINTESNNAIYANSLEEAKSLALSQAKAGDLIITIGAGDVNKICDMILLKSND